MRTPVKSLIVALIVLLCGLLLILLPLVAKADNARDWQNLPKDKNLIFGYYNNVRSNTDISSALPVDGISVDADVIYFVTRARFDIDGRISAIQIVQPYASVSASLDNSRYFTGSLEHENIGDTQVIFAHNLFGAPALSKNSSVSGSRRPSSARRSGSRCPPGIMTVITPLILALTAGALSPNWRSAHPLVTAGSS